VVFPALIDAEKEVDIYSDRYPISQKRSCQPTEPSKSANITCSIISAAQSPQFRIFQEDFFEEPWWFFWRSIAVDVPRYATITVRTQS
jgi:hypothetical protein